MLDVKQGQQGPSQFGGGPTCQSPSNHYPLIILCQHHLQTCLGSLFLASLMHLAIQHYVLVLIASSVWILPIEEIKLETTWKTAPRPHILSHFSDLGYRLIQRVPPRWGPICMKHSKYPSHVMVKLTIVTMIILLIVYIYIHLCTWYVHVQIYQSIDQHFWMTLLVEQFWLSFLILQLTTVGSQIVWAIVNSILKIGNIFDM